MKVMVTLMNLLSMNKRIILLIVIISFFVNSYSQILHFHAVSIKVEYYGEDSGFQKSDVNIYFISDDNFLYFDDNIESIYKLIDSDLVETKNEVGVYMHALDKDREKCMIAITSNKKSKYYYITILYDNIKITYRTNFIKEYDG